MTNGVIDIVTTIMKKEKRNCDSVRDNYGDWHTRGRDRESRRSRRREMSSTETRSVDSSLGTPFVRFDQARDSISRGSQRSTSSSRRSWFEAPGGHPSKRDCRQPTTCHAVAATSNAVVRSRAAAHVRHSRPGRPQEATEASPLPGPLVSARPQARSLPFKRPADG